MHSTLLALFFPILLLGHSLLDVNTSQPAATLLREKWEAGYKNGLILCLPQVLLAPFSLDHRLEMENEGSESHL